ncbi:caspase domain-containing protein, partial [Mycena leptocephala]
ERVAIGDVGKVTPDGNFDFFFNIYLPADHPIDANVPEGFAPLSPYDPITIMETEPTGTGKASEIYLGSNPYARVPRTQNAVPFDTDIGTPYAGQYGDSENDMVDSGGGVQPESSSAALDRLRQSTSRSSLNESSACRSKLENLEVVLEMRKLLLGEDHPDTLQTMHNLASTYRNLRQPYEAGPVIVETEPMGTRKASFIDVWSGGHPPARVTPKKRSLLIGIGGGRHKTLKNAPLAGIHEDVHSMRRLLIESYGYLPSDITTLLDDDEGVQPTRANILRAIDDMVHKAQEGDRFVFLYSGHTAHMKNRSNCEDGMDGYLIPADGEEHKITDDELRQHLIDVLPAGSSLVAVIDSCHNESLLDLARCKHVFVPSRKDRRPSDEFCKGTVRLNANPKTSLSTPSITIPTKEVAVLPPPYSPLPTVQESGNSPGNPSTADLLANHVACLTDRYDRLGDLSDLNAVLEAAREAVNMTLSEHPSRARVLQSFTASLADRYRKLGDLADFNAFPTVLVLPSTPTMVLTIRKANNKDLVLQYGTVAATLLKDMGNASNQPYLQAIDMTPPEHPSRAYRLQSLGESLITRFTTLGDLDDLNAAVETAREAVNMTPSGHLDRAQRLEGPDTTRLGNLADLDAAVETAQEAVDMTPSGHPS